MSIQSYFYNGANREKRAGYITGEDPSISAGAAQAYALLDYDPLNQFRNIGNAAFDSVAAKTSEFNNVRERFEKLAKSDPKAAEQLVLLYNELGPEKYGDVLSSFADNVAGDKDFAEKMINGLERSPDQLRQTFKAYAEAKDNRTLDSYINNVKGVRVAASTPAAPVAAPSSQSPASPASPSAPSAATPDTSGMTDDQIESLLNDPKYKDVVDKLKANGQYDRLVSGIKSNKKILDQLADPGTRKQIVALVQGGDIEGVFRKLGGIQIQTASGPIKMDDIFAQAKEGLGSMMGLLEGFGLGGAGERGKVLLGGLIDGFKNPGEVASTASMGTGKNIRALWMQSDKRGYAAELTETAVANLRAPMATGPNVKDPAALSNHGRKILEGMGLTPKQIDELKDGHTHVDVTKGENGEPIFTVKKADNLGKFVASLPAPRQPDYAVERAARDAERAAGVKRNEFGFDQLSTDPMPAGLQPSGAVTAPVQ